MFIIFQKEKAVCSVILALCYRTYNVHIHMALCLGILPKSFIPSDPNEDFIFGTKVLENVFVIFKLLFCKAVDVNNNGDMQGKKKRKE